MIPLSVLDLAPIIERLMPSEKAILADVLSCSAIGSPETVRRVLRDFLARTVADELIITSGIFDHAARLRSYEIVAQVRDSM